jgi:hypothetical protein
MKSNDTRVAISLVAILIFASIGLFALNKYRSSADTIDSSTTSTADSTVTDSSPFPTDTSSQIDSNSNSTNVSSTDSTDTNTDTTNNGTDTLPPPAPAADTTATSGTVSVTQSSALLDKQCVVADGKDMATIDVIPRDDSGNILVGETYKPQINATPRTGLVGKIVAGTSNDWEVQLTSTSPAQVTTQVGSQSVLITTLIVNFATSCPAVDSSTVTGIVDTTGSNASNSSTNPTNTKAANSKINIIYYIGAGLVLLIILAGAAFIFLKKRMAQAQLPETEEVVQVDQPPAGPPVNPTPPTNPPAGPVGPPPQA